MMNAAVPRGGRMRNRKGNTPDQSLGYKENYIMQGLVPYKRNEKNGKQTGRQLETTEQTKQLPKIWSKME